MIYTATITETSAGFCDIIDITAKLKERVRHAKVRNGIATLFVNGSTAALTTIEHEPGLVLDLKEFVEKYIPSNRRYHHDDRWGDNNGFSHLRASFFGPSLTIPITDHRLSLGSWQQVILLDFDNRPRTREIIVQLIGEVE
ncbi:MAG TPA: secondary thiamine-phosphate synthase enzyme YjbQ [Terriglobales bacterium]|jgi:secondary thiamine-phosphate synthase enzyme|nr:secondary thiamine-phosphate synthase enzyme YjbQ [Terriglobales bacterium]